MAQREMEAAAAQAAAQVEAAVPPARPSREEHLQRLHSMRHNPAYTYVYQTP